MLNVDLKRVDSMGIYFMGHISVFKNLKKPLNNYPDLVMVSLSQIFRANI